MSDEKQVQENPMHENTAGQENSAQMNGEQSNVPKKKKLSTGVKVVIALAALLVVGIAGLASTKIYQAVKKANMNPTDYYQYVLKKGRENTLKGVAASYEAGKKAMDGDMANREVDMSIEVSDTAKSLMSLGGLDLSGLKNLGLNIVYGEQGDDTLAAFTVKANDDALLTGKFSMNTETKKTYIQLPELSSSYLDLTKTMTKFTEQADGIQFSMKKQSEALPDTATLEKSITNFSDIYINNVKDVQKKSSTTIKVEDISEKADTYIFTMKNDRVVKMLEQYLQELQKDETFKAILVSADENAYQSFVKEAKELQESLSQEMSEDSAGEIKVTVETQINSDDRIVSDKFTVESAGEELGSLLVSLPKDGNKFGVEIALQSQGKDLAKFVGSGTEESMVVNGEFKLGVDSSLLEGSNLVNTDELLVIKLKDYDFSKMADGKVKGSCILSTSAVATLANCSLEIEQEGDTENMKSDIKVMMGKDVLATLNMTSKGKAELPDAVPGDSDKIYDLENNNDIIAYQSELDIAGLFQNIKDKTGIDFSSLLGLAALGDEGLTDPGDVMYDEGYSLAD